MITCHVHGKVFDISVGQGGQRLRWLAHVAIAKWDEDHNQGWKRLGIPTILKHNHKVGRLMGCLVVRLVPYFLLFQPFINYNKVGDGWK